VDSCRAWNDRWRRTLGRFRARPWARYRRLESNRPYHIAGVEAEVAPVAHWAAAAERAAEAPSR